MIGIGEQEWYKWTLAEDTNPDRVLVIINRQLFVAITIVATFSSRISLADHAKVVISILAIVTSIAAILYQGKLIKTRAWLGNTLTAVSIVCQTSIVCYFLVVAGNEGVLLLVVILVLLVVGDSANPRGVVASIAFCATILSVKTLQSFEQVAYILFLVQMVFILCFKSLWLCCKKKTERAKSSLHQTTEGFTTATIARMDALDDLEDDKQVKK